RAFSSSLSPSTLRIWPSSVTSLSTSFSLVPCSSLVRPSGDFFADMLPVSFSLLRGCTRLTAERAAEALQNALDAIDQVVHLLLSEIDRHVKGRPLGLDLDGVEEAGEAHHHQLRVLLGLEDLGSGLGGHFLGVALRRQIDVGVGGHTLLEIHRAEH